jgi:AcrR family transcriptional regulator
VSNYSYSQLAFGEANIVARKSRLSARKQPLQERSRETVAVILEAAARILEECGIEGYNTNAVAERGGVSVGSVYQYFPNKDALTLALIARFEDEILGAAQTAVAASDGKDLKTSLKLLIIGLLKAHEGRAQLNRILETEENRLRAASSGPAASLDLRKLLGSLLARHAHELGPVDAAVIDDLIVITRAMVDDALQKEISQTAASRRILRAVEGYLRWH